MFLLKTNKRGIYASSIYKNYLVILIAVSVTTDVGIIEPPKGIIEPTAISAYLPFTAPNDCIVMLGGVNQAGTAGYYMYFFINGTYSIPCSGTTPQNWQVSHFFPMRKGEILTLDDGGGLAYWHVDVIEILP